jgi:hypothetical protein
MYKKIFFLPIPDTDEDKIYRGEYFRRRFTENFTSIEMKNCFNGS